MNKKGMKQVGYHLEGVVYHLEGNNAREGSKVVISLA